MLKKGFRKFISYHIYRGNYKESDIIIKFIISIISLITFKTTSIYGVSVNNNEIYELNGKYIYTGDNPNNYILYNKELWRILYFDKGIKIIKNESLGKFPLKDFDVNNYYENASIITTNDFLNTIKVSENKYEENIDFYGKKTFIKTKGAWTSDGWYFGDTYFPDVDTYNYKFDIFPTIYLTNVKTLKGKGTPLNPYTLNFD